jgi:hypothetical protein
VAAPDEEKGRIVPHAAAFRAAQSPTGTVGGLTLSASELHFADLAITKTGTTIVCIGNGC